MADGLPGDLTDARVWAITSYFNPARFSSRYINYQVFRARLPLPLATIELGFGDRCELQPRDADLLVQVTTGDRLWQKERLLNKLLPLLPPACEFVFVLDADVIFESADSLDRAVELLATQEMVQPFARSYRLHPYRLPEAGVRHAYKPQPSVLVPGAHDIRGQTGLAWAFRRRTLERSGLYDRAILGGADRMMLPAALGRATDAVQMTRMQPAPAQDYLAWAAEFDAAIGRGVTHSEGDIFTLWHGNLVDRKYADRHKLLSAFSFDPAADIRPGPDETWLWSSDKPALHKAVAEYFFQRREDSRVGRNSAASNDPHLYLRL